MHREVYGRKSSKLNSCTVFFRGPHPTYSRKNYDVTLENEYNNPQSSNFNSADKEQMLSDILSEFMNSIIYRDIGRHERNLKEEANSDWNAATLRALQWKSS
ncbi:hypothetical protein GCK72_022655 [Caenorhabditis remanei]|uniref:Uncharacterized protein n=1 Tax=Caenorhabditis remanei TaxID=31234 RepID=A0A6A5FUG6_CAERE|nr:hypothetical protein GCK72_022655 [Caenorhabditis remanei]KAF1746202.1 hypothetical protein GCK72_022655 [Caenorhabditis remanei]